MTDLAKLVVTLEAQNAKYLAKLEQANRRLAQWENKAKKSVLNVKKLFAGLSVGLLVKGIADATREQEFALAQLKQGLVSTNQAAGKSLAQLQKDAADLQKVTLFGDEQIATAQAQLLTFTGIAGEQFTRTTELAADMATRFGTDMKSAVLQLGKALNDPVKNLSALSRAGIQFTDQQKQMINQLVRSNRLVDAQKIILKELETQFGGSARAARDTFGGALVGLKNAAGDLLETDSLGGAKTAIEKLTTLLQDPATVDGVNNLITALVTGFGAVVKVLTKVVNLMGSFSGEIAKEQIKQGAGAGAIQTQIELLKKQREGLEKVFAKSGHASTKTYIDAITRTIAELEVKAKKLREPAIAADNGVVNTQLNGLATGTKDATGALQTFKDTLDKINGKVVGLTPENGFRELTRLTAEARQAQVRGDTDKAVKLAEQGAKVIEFLKESGTETDSVLRGGLAKLEAIAAKALSPQGEQASAPTVGVLEIRGLGKSASIKGNEKDIRNFVELFTGALQAESVAVGG